MADGGAAEANVAAEVNSGPKPGTCGAFMQATFCAFCVAPIVLILGLGIAGWNEKRDVCNMHAISDGFSSVKQVGCHPGHPASHELVMFTCAPEKAPLSVGAAGAGQLGALTPTGFEGVGLRVEVEMLQCMETPHTSKDAMNHTITTYSYQLNYYGHSVKQPVGPKAAAQCGGFHPMWPTSVPKTQSVFNKEVKIGEYTLQEDYARMISLNTPVHPTLTGQWKALSHGTFENKGFAVGHQVGGGAPLGTLRAKFFSNSWDVKTVLGYEGTGKRVGEWHAPSAWMCSGFTLGTLREMALTKVEMFKTLHSENHTMTLFLRFLAFCMLWGAFGGMVAPLGVLADCLPFVQSCACLKCLADAFDVLLCAAACLPATACFCLVAGVVWVVMRPMVGGPMLLITVGAFGFMGYLKSVRKGGGGGANVEERSLLKTSPPE